MRPDEAIHVLSAMGIQTDKVKNYGEQIWTNCPFSHGGKPDANPSMAIKLLQDNVLCYCTACKFRGNLFSLAKSLNVSKTVWEEIHRLTKVDFETILADKTYIDRMSKLPEKQENKINLIDDKSMELKEIYSKFYPPDESTIAFYKTRDISLNTLNSSGAKYDPYTHRVYFPVYSEDRNLLVGIMGRTLVDEKPKWKNILGFKKSQYLYSVTPISSMPQMLITEGINDVLKLHELGIPAVSILGSEASEIQIEKILFYNKKTYIMLDGDIPGKEGTKKLFNKLSKFLFCRMINMEDGKDPCDITFQEVESIKGILAI